MNYYFHELLNSLAFRIVKRLERIVVEILEQIAEEEKGTQLGADAHTIVERGLVFIRPPATSPLSLLPSESPRFPLRSMSAEN